MLRNYFQGYESSYLSYKDEADDRQSISQRADISYVGDDSAICSRYVLKIRFIGQSY